MRRFDHLSGFARPIGDSDALVCLFDCHYAKARLVTPRVIEENAGGWVKISEGQAPSSPRDRDLARDIFDGAVLVGKQLARAGKAFGFYHYPTIGRDGSRHFWDVEDEIAHCLEQVQRAEAAIGQPARLRFILDAEDHRRDMPAEQRCSWLHWWLSRAEAELEHTPLLYLASRYVKKYLLDPDGTFGEPLSAHGFGMFDLMQPHYDNNDHARALVAPALPLGFSERAVWQFTSEYAGGLDRSVARLSRVMIDGLSGGVQ